MQLNVSFHGCASNCLTVTAKLHKQITGGLRVGKATRKLEEAL